MEQTEIKSKIESLLFVLNKPLSLKQLSKIIKEDINILKEIMDNLVVEYKEQNKGFQLSCLEDKYQLVTNPENSDFISDYLKKDLTSDLTRPALETLTIICYRGPIAKYELELIRGVNCGLILRNLSMRGLIEMKEDKEKKTEVYNISFDFLRYLGITEVTELPDYKELNSDKILERLLQDKENSIIDINN